MYSGYQSLVSWQSFSSTYFVDSLFNLETISFVAQKPFNFMLSHLSIPSFSFWAFWVLFRKSLPMPINSNVFPAFSYTSFKVSGCIFRSLIYFKLILIQGERHESSFGFLHADIQFSQQHLLKRLSFLHCTFLVLLSKMRWCSCVDFCPSPLFCSTGLHVCFWASTMLLLLLWL
jgi:hypothetical protein